MTLVGGLLERNKAVPHVETIPNLIVKPERGERGFVLRAKPVGQFASLIVARED